MKAGSFAKLRRYNPIAPISAALPEINSGKTGGCVSPLEGRASA
jgi:hypothetical protein